MRRAALVVLALAAGCGSGGPPAGAGAPPTTSTKATTTSTTSTSLATTTTSITMVDGKPHFDTPEAAMTYLAAAWNAHDTVALKQVTDPSARDELDAMHEVAVNLQLDRCEP